MGFPWAGVFGAWFLALHPWHLRYASEARGYSLVFTLIPLVWAVLLDALHHGSWRRWAAFGGAQFVLLWAFPAAVYLLVLTNLLALGAILTRHRGEARAQQGARWFSVNLFGAMLWALLMAGNVAQLIEWLERKGARDLGSRWIKTTLAYFLSGMPWTHRRHGVDPVYPELADLAAQTPWLFYAAVAATAALLLLGTLRLLREGNYRRWVALLLLAPGPLTWWVGYARGHHMHNWYLVFALPSFAALVALGATSAFRWARPPALSAVLSRRPLRCLSGGPGELDGGTPKRAALALGPAVQGVGPAHPGHARSLRPGPGRGLHGRLLRPTRLLRPSGPHRRDDGGAAGLAGAGRP